MEKAEGRYYADIEQLEIVFSAEEANQKLAMGYELLKIETLSSMQKLGDLTAQETRRLVFVLGRKKIETETKKQPPSTLAALKQAPEGQESPKEIIIPAYIPWKEQTSGFAWAFASNKDGSPIEEYKSFVERLKLSPLEKDGYRYSLSKDGKFLQRSKIKGSE
jgi:hypothetical protein